MRAIRLSCEPCACGPSPSNAVADRVALCSLLGGRRCSVERRQICDGLARPCISSRAFPRHGETDPGAAAQPYFNPCLKPSSLGRVCEKGASTSLSHREEQCLLTGTCLGLGFQAGCVGPGTLHRGCLAARRQRLPSKGIWEGFAGCFTDCQVCSTSWNLCCRKGFLLFAQLRTRVLMSRQQHQGSLPSNRRVGFDKNQGFPFPTQATKLGVLSGRVRFCLSKATQRLYWDCLAFFWAGSYRTQFRSPANQIGCVLNRVFLTVSLGQILETDSP